MVGEFLNKQLLYFLCFIKTYGLFKYKDDLTYEHIEQCSTVNDCNIDKLQSGLQSVTDAITDIDTNLKNSCVNPTHTAVLTEYIKDSISIKDKLLDNKFVSDDLLYALFQIYMPLSCLANKFTHYDLHWHNVLLYEPNKDGYIQYNYHIGPNESDVVSFKSSYIVKIIDYGRSYFDNGTLTSENVYEKVCNIKECDENNLNPIIPTLTCGKAKGYYWLSPFILPTSSNKNISHDLRLLNIILNAKYYWYIPKDLQHDAQKVKDYFKSNFPDKKIEDLNKKIVTEINGKLTNLKLIYNEFECTFNGYPNFVVNVTDACKILQDMIKEDVNKNANNKAYEGKNLIDDIHIYSDGKTPMKFL